MLLFGTFLGYILYLVVIKIARGRTFVSPSTAGTPALQRLWLQVIKTLPSLPTDTIERSDLSGWMILPVDNGLRLNPDDVPMTPSMKTWPVELRSEHYWGRVWERQLALLLAMLAPALQSGLRAA